MRSARTAAGLALVLALSHGPALAERLPRGLQRVARSAHCAGSICLLVDYDGTMRELQSTPDAARPTPGIMRLLRVLSRSPRLQVNLVSGRKRGDLEEWFGGLPIGLYAEHGLWSRPPGKAWVVECDLGKLRPTLDRVRPLVEEARSKLPGALLEEKSAGLAFHYRNAEPERGRRTAEQLAATLRQRLKGTALEVLEGNMVCEIRPRQANKGAVAKRIAARVSALARRNEKPSLLIAIGDDRTDEDLFKGAGEAPGAVTIKVGPGATAARYRLSDPRAVRAFLRSLIP